ncbi:MAG: hypothetical protein ACJ75F_04315 [Flavisolibacter sp.]
MKKYIVSFTLLLLAASSFAQSEKYMKTMQDKVGSLDSTRDPAALKDLSATFERIGDAEKTQWLPYYYSALTLVNSGYTTFMSANGNTNGMAQSIDPVADKAESILGKAEALSKDNSEIFILKKMIATLRMMVDPMNRYMTYGPQAQTALETAKKLNPENPRIYILEGEDKFYTPEQFGGSKTEAKKLFETASQKFQSFKPATEIDPNWGRPVVDYFMNQLK